MGEHCKNVGGDLEVEIDHASVDGEEISQAFVGGKEMSFNGNCEEFREAVEVDEGVSTGEQIGFVNCDDVGSPGCRVFEDNMRLETSPNAKGEGHETNVATPEVGMVYSSWEENQEIDLHVRCYAKQNGFGVSRTRAGFRQKGGKMTDVKRNVTWHCDL